MRTQRLIVAAAAAGLVLRLVFGLLYWTDQPLRSTGAVPVLWSSMKSLV